MLTLTWTKQFLSHSKQLSSMDYKKYSLEQLENWMYDAMSCGDATPQEIYDVIIEVVKDNYYTYKKQASQAYELLSLLNGNGKGNIKEFDDCVDKILSCDKDDPSPECKKSWTKFWEETPYPLYVSEDGDVWAPDYVTKEDKVKRWVLPTQVDGLTGDVIVNLPDDLLEGAGLKEGDVIEWIDRKDGSFEMRKVNGTK